MAREPGSWRSQFSARQSSAGIQVLHSTLRHASYSKEIFSDAEIRAPQQLAIGVPAGNLTFVSLAKQLEHGIQREQVPAEGTQHAAWIASNRETLASVVRYAAISTSRALRIDNSIGYNFRTLSYRFDYSNGLSATGIWFHEA